MASDRQANRRRHMRALWDDPIWRAARIEQLRANLAARMADPAYRGRISVASRRLMRAKWDDPATAPGLYEGLAKARRAAAAKRRICTNSDK